MTTQAFFDEPTKESRVKSAIVSSYFSAWARVIAKERASDIAYIDLFAGPGRYKDGTPSTPLLVLGTAIRNPDLRRWLITIFNDDNPEFRQSLDQAIKNIPGIETLAHKPVVRDYTVGRELAKAIADNKLIPTLFFIDPWGYKGVSLTLLNAAVKDWGCECILLFNYNRINPGLENDLVRRHMDDLFGQDRANNLRKKLAALPIARREPAILDEIHQALEAPTSSGERFVLPFKFKNQLGTRTDHHLIHVTKHFRGFDIMKQIMAKHSSSHNEGVATFEYCQADIGQPFISGLFRPLEDLAGKLLVQYAGQTITVETLFEEHSRRNLFTLQNYKSVLLRLEKEGIIDTDPPANARRRGTFANHVRVSFRDKGV